MSLTTNRTYVTLFRAMDIYSFVLGNRHSYFMWYILLGIVDLLYQLAFCGRADQYNFIINFSNAVRTMMYELYWRKVSSLYICKYTRLIDVFSSNLFGGCDSSKTPQNCGSGTLARLCNLRIFTNHDCDTSQIHIWRIEGLCFVLDRIVEWGWRMEMQT